MIDFRTAPERYRHWRLTIEGPIATLAMDVAEDGGLRPGYELKLNSYDLGVDIELADAVQRLRFEHPSVRAVVITSAKDTVFSAGANIRMLARARHSEKVNFCKFTNETRLAIEDASAHSGQTYLAAVKGVCAGGGYELALAADHIMLADDGSSSVSLPEIPLLAVLPGTGGLVRVVDKRKVRRDRADIFCTTEEGVRGKRALDWGLVDELVPRSQWEARTGERAATLVARSDRPSDATGVALPPLARTIDPDTGALGYPHLTCTIDRPARTARLAIHGPAETPPGTREAVHATGAAFWPLALARALDDLILHLRFNEPEIGTWLVSTQGDPAHVLAADNALVAHGDDWLVREIRLYWKRILKRFETSARSLFALVEPGSCYAGTLLELALAADRAYMLDGGFEGDNRPPATISLTEANFGLYPMANGLTRLATRFLGDADAVARARGERGRPLDAEGADALGLVSAIPDDIDWEDEIRIAVEERAAFSADALSGMEACLRFPGPETMESKIFGRLSAWQNWVFQRPNAIGEDGALQRYGTGKPAVFDPERV